MHPEEEPVAHVAKRLRERLGAAPATAIVLGSGLGGVLDRMKREAEVPYDDLGLPASTVAGHAGRAVVGEFGGARVVAMSGRVHRYEGHSASVVVRYVRALHRWGVKRLVLTCAAGSIRPDWKPGDLALITDHINMQGDNPLIGPVFGGPRFPDLSRAYAPDLRAALKAAGESVGTTFHEGVYVAFTGPSYETPAEIRMGRAIGADLVGMSTVPEAIAAASLGLPATAIALVSNFASGLTDEPLSHEEVTIAAKAAGERLTRVLEVFCGRFEAR